MPFGDAFHGHESEKTPIDVMLLRNTIDHFDLGCSCTWKYLTGLPDELPIDSYVRRHLAVLHQNMLLTLSALRRALPENRNGDDDG
jgi:hypothetical protein